MQKTDSVAASRNAAVHNVNVDSNGKEQKQYWYDRIVLDMKDGGTITYPIWNINDSINIIYPLWHLNDSVMKKLSYEPAKQYTFPANTKITIEKGSGIETKQAVKKTAENTTVLNDDFVAVKKEETTLDKTVSKKKVPFTLIIIAAITALFLLVYKKYDGTSILAWIRKMKGQ
jgi:hypothetical protein